MFQFLIGSLGAIVRSNGIIEFVVFQFLIGSLGAYDWGVIAALVGGKFQFLIGSLGAGDLNVGIHTGS